MLFSAILIVRNRSYANCLSQKLQVESVDLINKYKSLTPFEQSSWCIWTIGIRREMELRVFRIVFHSYYKLTRNFDFVKYLTLCKESNIIHLLTVNPAHWLTLIVLLAGNYGFVQYFTLSDQEIEFVRNRFCDGVINQKVINKIDIMHTWSYIL